MNGVPAVLGVAWIGCLVMITSACTTPKPVRARAEIRGPNGEQVGTAIFTRARGGLDIEVRVTGLPPGSHGMHIHRSARCEPPDFASAGDHFNPEGHTHGGDLGRRHAGDLPNLYVTSAGTGHLNVFIAGLTLEPGHHSLFQGGGTSLVVHAEPDDMKTDPSGAAGQRIACGVIVWGG